MLSKLLAFCRHMKREGNTIHIISKKILAQSLLSIMHTSVTELKFAMTAQFGIQINQVN